MPKPDNFQLQNAQALRQLAVAVERGDMIVTAVNQSMMDGRLDIAIHATAAPAEVRAPTIQDWGTLKNLCQNILPPWE